MANSNDLGHDWPTPWILNENFLQTGTIYDDIYDIATILNEWFPPAGLHDTNEQGTGSNSQAPEHAAGSEDSWSSNISTTWDSAQGQLAISSSFQDQQWLTGYTSTNTEDRQQSDFSPNAIGQQATTLSDPLGTSYMGFQPQMAPQTSHDFVYDQDPQGFTSQVPTSWPPSNQSSYIQNSQSHHGYLPQSYSALTAVPVSSTQLTSAGTSSIQSPSSQVAALQTPSTQANFNQANSTQTASAQGNSSSRIPKQTSSANVNLNRRTAIPSRQRHTYAPRSRLFANAQQAGAYRSCVRKKPKDDPTVAEVRKNQLDWVDRLYQAMIDLDNAYDGPKDDDKVKGRKRMPRGYQTFYDGKFEQEEIEAGCWRVLEAVLDRHIYGRKFHDRHNKADEEEEKLTCHARMETMESLLRRWKLVCLDVVNDNHVDRIVNHPRAIAGTKRGNATGNQSKREALAQAKRKRDDDDDGEKEEEEEVSSEQDTPKKRPKKAVKKTTTSTPTSSAPALQMDQEVQTLQVPGSGVMSSGTPATSSSISNQVPMSPVQSHSFSSVQQNYSGVGAQFAPTGARFQRPMNSQVSGRAPLQSFAAHQPSYVSNVMPDTQMQDLEGLDQVFNWVSQQNAFSAAQPGLPPTGLGINPTRSQAYWTAPARQQSGNDDSNQNVGLRRPHSQ